MYKVITPHQIISEHTTYLEALGAAFRWFKHTDAEILIENPNHELIPVGFDALDWLNA